MMIASQIKIFIISNKKLELKIYFFNLIRICKKIDNFDGLERKI